MLSEATAAAADAASSENLLAFFSIRVCPAAVGDFSLLKRVFVTLIS